MTVAANKLYLIGEILKIENEAVLIEIETVISRSKIQAVGGRSFEDFAGIMSGEEAAKMERIIEEGRQ